MLDVRKRNHLISRKKLILLVLVCATAALVGLGMRYFFSPKAAEVTVDALTPRAQEFITQQSKDGTGAWAQRDLRAAPAADSQIPQTGRITTECFSFSLPWKIVNAQLEATDQRCTWRAKTLAPLGHLVISSYISNSFNEDTGIVLRRSDQLLYKETELTGTRFTAAVLFESEGSLIIFAMKDQRMLTLALNDLATSTQVPQKELLDILDSFLVP